MNAQDEADSKSFPLFSGTFSLDPPRHLRGYTDLWFKKYPQTSESR